MPQDLHVRIGNLGQSLTSTASYPLLPPSPRAFWRPVSHTVTQVRLRLGVIPGVAVEALRLQIFWFPLNCLALRGSRLRCSLFENLSVSTQDTDLGSHRETKRKGRSLAGKEALTPSTRIYPPRCSIMLLSVSYALHQSTHFSQHPLSPPPPT